MVVRSALTPRQFLAEQAAEHQFGSALATDLDFQAKSASSAHLACANSSYFNSKTSTKPIAFGAGVTVSFSEDGCTKIKNGLNCKRTWVLGLRGEARGYQKLNDFFTAKNCPWWQKKAVAQYRPTGNFGA